MPTETLEEYPGYAEPVPSTPPVPYPDAALQVYLAVALGLVVGFVLYLLFFS